MALAQLLEEEFKVSETLALFDKLDADTLAILEKDYQEDIANLIQRSESQRPAYIRKLRKEHPEHRVAELVLLFAIMGQARVCKVIELRDDYREALAPGAGNRVTCANLYDFTMNVQALMDEYAFPFEVFEAYGSNFAWIDEPEDDED